MVSMCCNFSVTCMRYSIIRAQKYSKILEKPRKDHSLTFVIKMILLVYSYMFNYQIFERFVRVTVLLINDHKKSDKSLAGSCHTHEFVLLGNVFIAMEGNARFDVLEGCSAHHFVKLPLRFFGATIRKRLWKSCRSQNLATEFWMSVECSTSKKLLGILRSLNQMTSTVLALSVKYSYEKSGIWMVVQISFKGFSRNLRFWSWAGT